MTDTEAKALLEVRQNLANAAITGGMKNVRLAVDAALDMLDTLTDRLIAAAQAEARHKARTAVLLERDARHAAEMRELKERFGEAVMDWFGRYGSDVPLQFRPFITTAPDMVSEWLSECSDGRVSDHTMTMLRLFHHWLSEKETRKIGEAGND